MTGVRQTEVIDMEDREMEVRTIGSILTQQGLLWLNTSVPAFTNTTPGISL